MSFPEGVLPSRSRRAPAAVAGSIRVVSLLPAATEIVSSLGGEASLVGISHECDYPPSVQHLPRLTTTPVDASQPGPDIDRQVRQLRLEGKSVITTDLQKLAALRPDLIITQDLCEVCAVVDGDLVQITELLHPAPTILSLTGRTVAGVCDDIDAIAEALGLSGEGQELAVALRYRLGRVNRSPPLPHLRPRVVCIEWLEPMYLAGHWVPELVWWAGGIDAMVKVGDHSRRSSWAELIEKFDLIMVMLCGFDVERTIREWAAFLRNDSVEAKLAQTMMCPIWALDGNAYTSRPGPRILEGAIRIHAALSGVKMPGLTRLW